MALPQMIPLDLFSRSILRGMCCRQCHDIESIALEEICPICFNPVLVATVRSASASAAAKLISWKSRKRNGLNASAYHRHSHGSRHSVTPSVCGEASNLHLEPQCPPQPFVPSRQASMRPYQRSSYPVMRTLVRISCSLFFSIFDPDTFLYRL